MPSKISDTDIYIYIYEIMKRNTLLRIMNLTSTLTLFDSRRHGLSVIRSMNMEREREETKILKK